MLYINPNSDQVNNALYNHSVALRCRVTKKLGVCCLKKNCPHCIGNPLVFNSKKPIENNIKEYLLDGSNLDDIITAKPDFLMNKNEDFFKKVASNSMLSYLDNYFKATKDEKKATYPEIHNLILDIQKLFDYDWLSNRDTNDNDNYSLYDLAEKLNRRSCTYCNRSYTNTMRTNKNGKLMRPQFDHWFPKWRYPLLAVSFFNLIPSCYTCNSSSKGRDIYKISDHIHPYVDINQENDFSFSFINYQTNKYHIYIRSHNLNKKALNTLKALHIDTMYNAHHPELIDLIKIKVSPRPTTS